VWDRRGEGALEVTNPKNNTLFKGKTKTKNDMNGLTTFYFISETLEVTKALNFSRLAEHLHTGILTDTM